MPKKTIDDVRRDVDRWKAKWCQEKECAEAALREVEEPADSTAKELE